MAKNKKTFGDTINDLFRREDWATARKLLKEELKKDPENHWLLTQLGVTFYEQRRYVQALKLIEASLKIKADCPLTLWNLAGTLDMLGKHRRAIEVFSWLLASKTSPAADPCWESEAWANALKTDTVYRLGACYDALGEDSVARPLYRQYLDLLLKGGEGTYSIEDVTGRIRALQSARGHKSVGDELRKAVKSALQLSGGQPRNGGRSALLRACKRIS
jgi:tetratricopeptide (TPR) repeat protein